MEESSMDKELDSGESLTTVGRMLVAVIAGWVGRVKVGRPTEVVAGVAWEKREGTGAAVVVVGGAVAKENAGGRVAEEVRVAAVVDGLESENREVDGVVSVGAVVAAGAPPNEKPDEI